MRNFQDLTQAIKWNIKTNHWNPIFFAYREPHHHQPILLYYKEQWSSNITKKEQVELVDHCTINQIKALAFKSLPFESHSRSSRCMPTPSLMPLPQMSRPQILIKAYSLQTWLAVECFDFFIVRTIIKFWTHEEELQEKKLKADQKAHNACQKQDQLNHSVETALEKEN